MMLSRAGEIPIRRHLSAPMIKNICKKVRKMIERRRYSLGFFYSVYQRVYLYYTLTVTAHIQKGPWRGYIK